MDLESFWHFAQTIFDVFGEEESWEVGKAGVWMFKNFEAERQLVRRRDARLEP